MAREDYTPPEWWKGTRDQYNQSVREIRNAAQRKQDALDAFRMAKRELEASRGPISASKFKHAEKQLRDAKRHNEEVALKWMDPTALEKTPKATRSVAERTEAALQKQRDKIAIKKELAAIANLRRRNKI